MSDPHSSEPLPSDGAVDDSSRQITDALESHLSVLQVARRLGLHPFEVARMLGAVERLPEHLALDTTDVRHLVGIAGIETWWPSRPELITDDRPDCALVRTLARQLLDRGVVEPRSTRVDNLFRGLATADARVLRKAVNQLIRRGWLRSGWNRRGFQVSVSPEHVDDLRDLLDDRTVPGIVEEICA